MQQLKPNLVSLIKIWFLWWRILVVPPWYQETLTAISYSYAVAVPKGPTLPASSLSFPTGSPAYSPSDWLLYSLGDWFTRSHLRWLLSLYLFYDLNIWNVIGQFFCIHSQDLVLLTFLLIRWRLCKVDKTGTKWARALHQTDSGLTASGISTGGT